MNTQAGEALELAGRARTGEDGKRRCFLDPFDTAILADALAESERQRADYEKALRELGSYAAAHSRDDTPSVLLTALHTIAGHAESILARAAAPSVTDDRAEDSTQ